jgi:hypothetical protein
MLNWEPTTELGDGLSRTAAFLAAEAGVDSPLLSPPTAVVGSDEGTRVGD